MLAKELHVFGHFFGMNGKKLVSNHPFEIVTQGNKLKCLNLKHKVVSLREWDARMHVMVCRKHATESGNNRPG